MEVKQSEIGKREREQQREEKENFSFPLSLGVA